MKKLLRIVGIFMLLLSILAVSVSGKVADASEPYEVRIGVISDGDFFEMNRGYIGGNEEIKSETVAVQGIGYIGCFIGAVMILGSFLIKKSEPLY